MRQYTPEAGTRFVNMVKSIQRGESFYYNHALPFFKLMIRDLTQTSKHTLKQLEVKEDPNTRWVAYFKHSYVTKEMGFYVNKNSILKANIPENASEKAAHLNAVFQLALTCCHEFRHYEQANMVANAEVLKMDPKAILYAKEDVLIREDLEFYKQNHDLFIMEMDAMVQAFDDVRDLALTAKGLDLEDAKKIIRNCKAYASEYKEDIIKYRSQNGFGEEIAQRFDQTFSRLSQSKRQMYLNAMPVLTLVYNQDGSKNSYRELMRIKNELIENKKSKTINQQEVKLFEENLTRTINVIINSDNMLRKQRDNDYQNKGIKRENNHTQELDEFGVPLSQIQKAQRELQEAQKKYSHKGISR